MHVGGKIDQVNIAFLREGCSSDEYRAGIAQLKVHDLIDMHVSGTYFTFADKAAQRFA